MEVQSWVLRSSSSDSIASSETETQSTSSISASGDKNCINLSVASFRTQTPQISCLAVHDNTLYAASMNEINVFDLTDYSLVDTFRCNESSSGLIKSVAFGRGKIFTAHQDCKIRVWKLDSSSSHHRLVSTLPTVRDRLRRCVSPKNYVSVRRHKKRLWIEHYDAVSGLAINQGLMYSVSWDRCFRVWRMSDLRCLESVRAHDDAVNAVAVSPVGTIYTASADGRIGVWAREEGKRRRQVLVATLDKHTLAVNALVLTSDGSTLASGGCDRLIMVWEREESGGSGDDHQMVVKWTLRGHSGAILCLITVDDVLLSGSSDRTVRVWKRGVGIGYYCVSVLQGHEKPVKSLVAVSGSTSGSSGVISVISGGLDGEIKVWKVQVSNSDSERLDSDGPGLSHDDEEQQ